ncbi:cdc42 effector protein 3 [Callorhinchus milii]|uniref:CDC42 effector protein (Rho GTPase binding) 3 n=1 Tax=Callorhinchus milii TaxID=7868 RepID=V9KDN7_CALMI|nr:cdc42 effector protein 3 [Callorhinchus milii]XP_007892108.1 cdc42 effector protein 3 [Callorhinchus milii]|eukprot:gi/632952903/ref/XP_007892107.1/ PREDICTED: cdc42 effector protein 3 [Callorhinchus milii]
MPAKTPIYLKTTNSKKGKKIKLRDILSPDMISPPLGDFRHTIHIGKGGEHDVFGDISFLQGKYDLLPGNQGKTKFGQYSGHSEFLRANSTPNSTYSDTPSPVLKNAISLPSIGGSQALTLPLLTAVTFVSKSDSSAPPKPPRLHPATEQPSAENGEQMRNGKINGVEKGEEKLPSVLQNGKHNVNNSCNFMGQTVDCKKVKVEEDSYIWPAQNGMTKLTSTSEDSLLNLTGSLLSLQLDLGPSILDDVLYVMDKKKQVKTQ